MNDNTGVNDSTGVNDAGAEGMAEPTATVKRRRTRSVTESLLSIALGLEAVLMFFVTIAAFALRELPPAVAFGGGAALLVLLLVAVRLLRYPWGVWVGWALQVAIIATGFVMPLMFFIGAGFVALWIYCFVTGHRLDKRNRQFAAQETTKETP